MQGITRIGKPRIGSFRLREVVFAVTSLFLSGSMRFGLLILCCALCVLSACHDEAGGVTPGQTTLPQLLSRMGQPSMVWSDGDGSLQLEFSHVLDSGGNYMALVSANGTVISVQQVLTDSVVDSLQAGMSQDQVRRRLGRPASVESSTEGDVWHWPLAADGRPVVWQVDAHFGARGMLLEVQRKRVPVLPHPDRLAGHVAHS